MGASSGSPARKFLVADGSDFEEADLLTSNMVDPDECPQKSSLIDPLSDFRHAIGLYSELPDLNSPLKILLNAFRHLGDRHFSGSMHGLIYKDLMALGLLSVPSATWALPLRGLLF